MERKFIGPRIYCHTNLDLVGEQWPELDHVPQIGAKMISTRGGKTTTELHLEVRDVYYHPDGRIQVELTLPSTRWESLEEFHKWYRLHR